jgi:hypothetical protein
LPTRLTRLCPFPASPVAETDPAGIDLKVLADLDAVMKRIFDGTPVDPETSRRIEELAGRITEEIRRTRGVIDDARFQALLSRRRGRMKYVLDASVAFCWFIPRPNRAHRVQETFSENSEENGS